MDNNLFKKRDDESFEDFCYRVSSLKDSIENATWTTIAQVINREWGVDYSSDKYRKEFKRRKEMDTYTAKETPSVDKEYECSFTPFEKESVAYNFDKDETTSVKELQLTQEQLRNPNELLRAHGYDPELWAIRTATNTRTARTSPSGEYHYYASRITIKPRVDTVQQDELEVAKYLENYEPPRFDFYQTENEKSEETLVVPLYDLHWGRLPDTEHFVRYDIEEEKKRIISHVLGYVSKFHGRRFRDIYLIVGQDFLNSSFTGFTSSQSHLQSNAIDFRTMFRTGSELLISIINMFLETGSRLTVVGSLGNHATSEEVALFSVIKAYYRLTPSVEVDDGTAPRKYYKIGATGVGFGHLDKEKDRAYGLMQSEAKYIWANTKTHIFIAGHLHHFEVNSNQGVELYRVPSICPPDRWTVEQGFVQNEPKTMCFVFNENDGLIETHFMYL